MGEMQAGRTACNALVSSLVLGFERDARRFSTGRRIGSAGGERMTTDGWMVGMAKASSGHRLAD